MNEPVRWDKWRRFPTLSNSGFGTPPIHAGIYWLRNRDTGEDVVIGVSEHVAQDLPELLLQPPIKRSSHDQPLQQYVTGNVAVIEYRTAPFATLKQATDVQTALLKENPCLFGEGHRPIARLEAPPTDAQDDAE